MPLLKEGVFSVLSLLAAISIRVLKAITKVIENTKEPAHFRILNLTPNINGSTMQPVSELPDLSLNNARSADHRGGVENCRLRHAAATLPSSDASAHFFFPGVDQIGIFEELIDGFVELKCQGSPVFDGEARGGNWIADADQDIAR